MCVENLAPHRESIPGPSRSWDRIAIPTELSWSTRREDTFELAILKKRHRHKSQSENPKRQDHLEVKGN